jgi:hypothetical protein
MEAFDMGGSCEIQKCDASNNLILSYQTIRGKLQNRKKQLSEELDRLNKIEKLLDDNPAIEQFTDLCTNARF